MKEISIIGQGYVGLPLAKAFCQAGFRVVGVDSSESKVKSLAGLDSTIEDVSSGDLSQMIHQGYIPTTDFGLVANSDAIIICVPTPLSENGEPDLSFVVSAGQQIALNMKSGALVVLESTTYPGTTEEILLPILEREGLSHGSDFFLAFSPERIDPGNKVFGIHNTPKVVGGVTSTSSSLAASLYQNICENVVTVSGTREAEMSKLLENTYRHVNIALVNELAIVCNELGIDIREVIRAAKTKPFGFTAFEPGPGVGGHCIPIDPNYLDFKIQKELGHNFEFISLATKVNSEMPLYVANRIIDLLEQSSTEARQKRILLVGASYKRDISDVRETPALKILQSLLKAGWEVMYHDPLVEEWIVDDRVIGKVSELSSQIAEFDCVVLLQNHTVLDMKSLVQHSKAIFDTRGVLSKSDPRIHHL